MNAAITFDLPFASSHNDVAKEETCLQLWQHTIGYVNHVLEAHNELDLLQFKTKVDPSVDDLLQSIDSVKLLLESMAKSSGLTHTAATALLNCSRGISELRCIFDCVVRQDQPGYDKCIERLNSVLGGCI